MKCYLQADIEIHLTIECKVHLLKNFILDGIKLVENRINFVKNA